jgi:TRAP transporter TAXI family solute receptor
MRSSSRWSSGALRTRACMRTFFADLHTDSIAKPRMVTVARRRARDLFSSFNGREKMLRVAVIAVAILASLCFWTGLSPAQAQAVPKSLQNPGPEAIVKERKNAGTVGLVGGQLSGTYMTFADELARALDDGDNLRVLPIVSYGAASNLEDLLYLRGVDVAVTQSDVFEYFRTERKVSNLDNRIHYIIRLPASEMHLLAKTDIKSIEDLRGKKVNFGPPGSGSSLTGAIVFQRLGIQVEALHMDNPAAMQKLKSGEIAALIRQIGKPIDFFTKVPASDGLHLVPIPFSKTFADYYMLGEFTSQDYPGLVPQGGRTDTIAVPTVLAVYNWQRGTERYRKVERFVNAMFAKWEKLQKPPFHPKWKDVNLAATVPGWHRFAVAEQQLQQVAAARAPTQQELNRDFQSFLGRPEARTVGRSPADQEALFREFLKWREQQQQQQQAQPQQGARAR